MLSGISESAVYVQIPTGSRNSIVTGSPQNVFEYLLNVGKPIHVNIMFIYSLRKIGAKNVSSPGVPPSADDAGKCVICLKL